MILAAVLLLLFSVVASTDSLYFHTYKYQLHRRLASRREHLYHTANICLFVPQTYLMFCVRPSGIWLLAVAILSITTFGIELGDVLCENDSRRDLGGVTSAEYAMHFAMSAFRAGFIGVFFANTALGDFVAPAQLNSVPLPLAALGWCMVIPGAAVALFHVKLCFAQPMSPREDLSVSGAVSSAKVSSS